YIYREFNKYPWLKQVKNLPIVTIGGSIKNIAQIHICNSDTYIEPCLHNFKMNYSEISYINNRICSVDYNERVNIKGVSKKRSEVISSSSNFMKYLVLYIVKSYYKYHNYRSNIFV
ncbi:MAG: hypothetical protein ACLTG7_10770, partial [Romboutsia sp.]